MMIFNSFTVVNDYNFGVQLWWREKNLGGKRGKRAFFDYFNRFLSNRCVLILVKLFVL